MLSTEENLRVISKQIQQLDNSIRFVGIANNLGSLIATAYRNGLIPLMDEQETSHYAIYVVLRAATREYFESKIGRLEYSIGKYERVIRATVSVKACQFILYLLLRFVCVILLYLQGLIQPAIALF
jgi:hypothetical protein